jgi:predicted alpha/beta hydrolase family esterase
LSNELLRAYNNMENKIQVFIIHGGMTFKSKKDYLHFLRTKEVSIDKKIKWSDEFLEKNLGKNFEIIKPRMPLADNAKYEEWKVYFERFFPLLNDNIILIGSSLGGTFLAKYLSENKFPKKILSTYLICPPYDNTLPGEDLVGGFKLKSDLSLLEKNSKNLYLMFSKDDDVVPLAHIEKFKKKLKNADFIIYESKNGHFKIPEFPEIIKMIKSDVKKMS